MHRTRDTHGLDRVVQHERRWAWPLFAASIIWIGCLTAVWVDRHPDRWVRQGCGFVLLLTWIWFVVDYLIRLVLASGSRRVFIRTRAFDLVTIAVPFLRPFMILVFVWRLPALTGTASRLRLRYGVMTVLFTFLFVYVSAYLVWAVEKRAPHANIVNFGDAVWWAFTTITTVGYGDFVPVTLVGRMLAVGLMLGGLLVVGVTTATLISAISDYLREFAIDRKLADAETEDRTGVGDAADPATLTSADLGNSSERSSDS